MNRIQINPMYTSTAKAKQISARCRNILVIGAGSSIGENVCQKFLDSGDVVLGTVHRNPSTVQRAENFNVLTLDLADPDEHEPFSHSIAKAFCPIDVIIFLSGVLPGLSLTDYTHNLISKVMSINFVGPANLLTSLLPIMADGSIVLMMSSISAERGSFDPIYAASKAAQVALVKSLSQWLSPKIRFNAIAPSLIESSEMFINMPDHRRAFHLERTPTQRFVSKDEIAGIIYSLCEPEWSSVNGQVIRVNGGSYV